MELLPAIDLRDGKVVRLFQGDYDKMTVYGEDPAAQARAFAAAGARNLHVVDLDGAKDGTTANFETIRRIVQATGKPIQAMIGDSGFVRTLKAAQFTDERFGEPTVRDILKELEKPGRDPRPEFKAAQFADGVEDIKDLREGMILEGVVSNVAAFGAFVDIGVHQDGLIHISALSDKFVKDPREVVKAGDIVKVKVLEVDVPRKRIALTCRLDDVPGDKPARESRGEARSDGRGPRGARPGAGRPATAAAPANNALADAFARARGR